MTDEMDLTPVIKTWLKDTLPSSSESARVFDAVADQVPTMHQQRHPWPPLPTGRRRAAIPVITAGNELEPRPLATTSPTRGRALQPLVSVSSLVATGVIAALIGGFLLVAQPSGQQPEGMPGAATGGPGSFSPAGSLAQPRTGHTATLLPDGRVLVIGGSKGGNETMAEVWDPTTASFAPAGQLHEGRRWHTATLLSDGRVLVVGGAGWLEKQRAQAEVWDPTTSTFGPAGSPTTARFEHTATLMPDGRILIVGGCCGEASAEIRDPASEIFGPAASLSTGRHGHTATPLADGRVLIVGGSGDDPEAIASVEVWAPSAE